MTMRERMAKAISACRRGSEDYSNHDLDLADAALEALREPTAAMEEAGLDCPVIHMWVREKPGDKGERIADPIALFTAMIDAILAEKDAS